jgi:hypothetical protein
VSLDTSSGSESCTKGGATTATTIAFARRQSPTSAQAHAQTTTELELAQLYAHVHSMPDGQAKRRFVKKVYLFLTIESFHFITVGRSKSPTFGPWREGAVAQPHESCNQRLPGMSHARVVEATLWSKLINARTFLYSTEMPSNTCTCM